MASAVILSVISGACSRLGSAMVDEVFSWIGANDIVKDLNQSHKILQAVLATAQDCGSDSKDVIEWLSQLEEVADELDNLIDESCVRIAQAKRQPSYVSTFSMWWYKRRLAGKVKSSLRQLQSIASTRSLLIGDFRTVTPPQYESHCSIPEIFLSREDSERTMRDYLIQKEYADDFVVIAIVGMGGMGKTTLAQFFFHRDADVKHHFELMIWVDVSDNFNVKSILKKMVKCVTHENLDHLEMEPMKGWFWKRIKGKRFLIVMDNVWGDDVILWSHFRDLLIAGAKGSKVVITTRNMSVAEAARPAFIYKLPQLSEDDSWTLFQRCAFKDGHVSTNDHHTFGKEIVKKCCGIPLAIKTVGLLLCTKRSIEEWRTIKDKELVNIEESGKNILEFLEVSYNHLPFHLKMCFLFCQIFCKGELIDRRKLVRLFMAHGLIQKSDVRENERDVGFRYVEELIGRSFLESDGCKVRIHDLMYDLSKVLSKGKIIVSKKGENVSSNTQHVLLLGDDMGWNVPSSMVKAKRNLRTLICGEYLAQTHFEVIVASCKNLRVLELSDCDYTITPSIGKLVLLRYLNLSINGKKELPESITDLWHLKVLKLYNCFQLGELPRGMKKMVNLTELLLPPHLNGLPEGIGELTKLCILPYFTVSKNKKHATLEELRGLRNLRDKMNIGHLERVKEIGCEGVLEETNCVKEIILEWSMGSHNDNQTMDALKPHINLERLTIVGYGGKLLSDWVFCLSALTHITIHWCENLSDVSKLHLLCSLKTFKIMHCDLEFVDQCEYNVYENLESISFIYCLNLKGWSKRERSSQFPKLSDVWIYDCPGFAQNSHLFKIRRLIETI